jgi:Domain of unknown function (DUF4375)
VSAEADAVWNRATTTAELTAPGDRALQALLLVHGQIMNGGLLSALDYIEPEAFERAEVGFAYFGLDNVTELLRRAYAVAFPDGPVETELREDYTIDLPDSVHAELEALDRRYSELIPRDQTLADAFERRFVERSGDFAPI